LFLLGGFQIHSNVSSKNILSNGAFPANMFLDRIIKSEHKNDEDILIIDESRLIGGIQHEPLISEFYNTVLTISQTKKTVIFYMLDDSNQVNFNNELICYMAHLNIFANLNVNAKPLPFGFSLDLINKSELMLGKYQRSDKLIINNFNITLNQSIRALMEITLVPKLEEYFSISNSNLTHEEYLEQLLTSMGILAYGGHFYQNILTSQFFSNLFKDNQSIQMQNNFVQLFKKSAIFRWDSWRFWEALVFGCPTFQLKFELYGMSLPVLPEPWSHYLPIDLSNIGQTVEIIREKIFNNQKFLNNVSQNSRAWAIEHYHPKKVAQRFLRDINH
jgi:hypothetical protein